MAYEEAKEFLARVVPWPAQTDPPEFFVNIHSPTTLPNGRKAFGGRACRTLNEAIRFVEYVANKSDVYVCMSAQRIGRAKTDKRGRAYWNAARSIQNAVWHRSFYIDVDVKPGGFESTQDALDAFGQFCDAADLPMPTFIVLSGSGGFHAHWVIDDPIPTSVWLPVAQGLVGAMRHHGFVVDYGCTIDAARILRVPDTFNYKHDPPAPVTLAHSGDIYTLDRIASRVSQYTNIKAIKIRPAHGVLNHRQNNIDFQISPLAAGLPTELVPNQQESLPSLREIEEVCPFIKHAHVSGGQTFHQPLWWETAKLAFYMREGVAALRAMANAHPDYKADENDALYERVVQERTPVDQYGWPQCDTLMNQGSPSCANCKWMKSGAAHGRSPFNFLSGAGRVESDAGLQQDNLTPVTTPVTFPSGYYQDAELRVWKHAVEHEDGKVEPPIEVSPYPVKGFTPIQGPPARLMFEADLDQRGFIPLEISSSAVAESASAMSRQLGDQGMILQKFRLEPMRSFLSSFTEQLRSMRQNSIKPEPFGWSFIGDVPDAFAYGGKRCNSHGEQPAAFTDRTLQTTYRRVGERSNWDRAIKFINDQHRPALEAIAAATFGSVFMEFTGERGLLWSAVGPTGAQKTTIMRIATSIWAQPQTALKAVRETVNSLTKTLGHLRNIPLLIDDVRDAAESQELLFRLGQGKDRDRLTRGAKLQETGTWSSFLITTSNHSMLAAAADMSKISPAGIYRIFEFPVALTTTELSEEARKVLFACDHNYGIAGHELSKWLGANAPLLPEIVQETVHNIGKELGATPMERFWVAGIACEILGAKIPNGIGLANFDVDALYHFSRQAFDNLRRYIERAGADGGKPIALISLLADFVNYDRKSVLFTDHYAPKVRGQPNPVKVTRNAEIQQYTPKFLLAHVATVDKLVRIPRARFSDFLKQRNWPRDQTYAELENRLNAKRDRVALGAGTSISMAADHIFEIDLKQSAELLELFDL